MKVHLSFNLSFLLLALTFLLLPLVGFGAPATQAISSSGAFQPGQYLDDGGNLVNRNGRLIALEYGADNGLVLNGTDYDMMDIFSLQDFINVPDDLSIPREEYFEFTEENEEASGHVLFYSLWSLHAQTNAYYTSVGEWGLFNRQYLANRNFLCSFDVRDCSSQMIQNEIIDMYPENRPLARLVLFTTFKYAGIHSFVHAVHDELKQVGVNLEGYGLDLVKSFTRQPKMSRVEMCTVIKEVLRTTAQLSLTVASAGFAGALPDFTKINFPTEGLGKAWKLTGEGKMLFHPVGKAIESLPKHIERAYDRTMKEIDGRLQLDTGSSSNILCGGFEGDEKDRSAQNLVKLKQFLVDSLDSARKQVRREFQKFTKGDIFAPGQPSTFAVVMQSTRFVGPGSIREQLENMEPIRDEIQKRIAKSVMGSLLASDGNYVVCTHDENAPYMCMEAKGYRALPEPSKGPKKINGHELSKAMQAVFCPIGGASDLVCQAGRTYPTLAGTHTVPYAGLKAFESFKNGAFNLTFEDMMQEGWANYLRFGNKMKSSYAGFTTGKFSGVGFQMPVCYNKVHRILNFDRYLHPHERPTVGSEVPSCCGTRCSETQDVFKLIKLEIGSKKWSGSKTDKPTFLDRIPRILDRLRPYDRYMGWGNAGIKFPRQPALHLSDPPAVGHGLHYFSRGVDVDFRLIRNATQGMDRAEANVWFCRDGRNSHTVFKREAAKALLWGKLEMVKSSQRACADWRGKYLDQLLLWDEGDKEPLRSALGAW